MIKQVYPLMSDRIHPVEVDLTPEEKSAMNAALLYLERQFSAGYKQEYTEQKRVEVTNSVEYDTVAPQPVSENKAS